MPLKKSQTGKPDPSNIRKLIAEGYPNKQAVAISYSEAGEPSKSKPRKKK